jgi:hypothetical protein
VLGGGPHKCKEPVCPAICYPTRNVDGNCQDPNEQNEAGLGCMDEILSPCEGVLLEPHGCREVNESE